MRVKGRLQLNIFQDIDGKKCKIGSVDDVNKITLSGKQVMAFLMAGEPGNHKISKFGVGTGTSFPDDYDTGLTNAYIRDLVGYRFLEPTVIQWDFAIDPHEANGLTLGEFGLYSEDEQLFARKIRTPGIVKDSSVSFAGQWTVWLIECRKTTFSSYVIFDFVITNPSIDYENTVHVAPIITHVIISDAGAERGFASTGNIIFNTESGTNALKLFTAQVDITYLISDPMFEFDNVERRFTSVPNLFSNIDQVQGGVRGRFENLLSSITFDMASDIDIIPDKLIINDSGDYLLINDANDKLKLEE
jgi:hypothetical protein